MYIYVKMNVLMFVYVLSSFLSWLREF